MDAGVKLPRFDRRAVSVEALERALIGAWYWDPVEDKVHWSPRMYRIVGLDPSEPAPSFQEQLAFYEAESHERMLVAIRQCLVDERPFTMQIVINNPVSGPRILIARCGVRDDGKGGPVGLVGTVSDITDQIEAENSLRLADAVFETTEHGICITDLDRKILRVNPAYEALTGYSSDELDGQDISITRSLYYRQADYEALWKSVSTTGYWAGEAFSRRKSGDLFASHVTIQVVRDSDGEPSHYVGFLRDISEQRRQEERIKYLANYDGLTGLPNRALFYELAGRQLEAQSVSNECWALMYIDIDHFSRINDTLGHKQGDDLLRQVADRVKNALPEGALLARQGGDEMMVFIQQNETSASLKSVANRILSKIRAPLPIGESEIGITASIGISLHPHDGATVDDLLKHADIALHAAKDAGRNTSRYFSEDMIRQAQYELMIENDLRRALNTDELQLYLQPQFDLHSQKIRSMEGLIRWKHPREGLLLPGAFIDVAERSGLIVPLGAKVLSLACDRLVFWRERGLPVLPIAINVSAQQLLDLAFIRDVQKTLRERNIDPKFLVVEITEKTLVSNGEQGSDSLLELAGMGVKISIDDFGTGYSSLNYLRHLTVDQIKIDRSFVSVLPEDRQTLVILRAITAMARELNVEVVAEGIETNEQIAIIKDLGISSGQGFLLGIPTADGSVKKIKPKKGATV